VKYYLYMSVVEANHTERGEKFVMVGNHDGKLQAVNDRLELKAACSKVEHNKAGCTSTHSAASHSAAH